MSVILDGKVYSAKVKEGLKFEIDELKKKGIEPKLAVIMVGNDSSSEIYVRNKSKACEKVGIEFEEFLLDESTSEEELLKLIDKLNNDNSVNGILLQSPVPGHISIDNAFEKISPEKDVDGFNPVNVGKLSIGRKGFVSCTPLGIIKLLEEYNVVLEGKNAVVIGRSNIVGKPMAQCLLSKNATVTICHSRTQNIKEIVKNADIVVSAIGKPHFIIADMIKDGAVIVDVGINRLNDGKIVGDVDFENVEPKASFITPVPGGVGPMTIAMLLNNLVEAVKLQNNILE